jgi:HdeA/HdeB family
MQKALIIAGVLALAATSSATAQTSLSAYADPKGNIDVQKLTCKQLANTYQEDANFLGTWYSGWYNGLGKKHSINIPRVKEGIHRVIVYCKENQDKTIIQAIDLMLKNKD